MRSTRDVVRVGLARYQVKLWRPEDHPRDPRTGRFIPKPGGPTWRRRHGGNLDVPGGTQLIGRRRNLTAGGLRRMNEDDLFTLYTDILSVDDESQVDHVARQLVEAELDRRSNEPPDDSTPEERRVDDLVFKGWSYEEAYAEVHGLDPEQLRREQANAAVDVDRRAGETRRQAIQRAYREYVHLQWLAAEQATNGHLLTRAAQSRGIDPISLFSGPAARARKWASEDLKRWWADNPRVTLAEFTDQINNRRAQSLAGNGRDFGV
ncbi:hypothetical protein ACQSSU_20630 [Micromonospora echinospora]